MRDGRAGEIFQDAESLFVDSLEQLDAGKLRNAAAHSRVVPRI